VTGVAPVDAAAAQPGSSFWLEPAAEPAASLEGAAEAEVAVVGAGYAGLSTAIELRRRGISVAVLEREYAGFGASGRNAGHLTPTIGKDLPSLLKGFGRERGGALVRLADGAVEHVESLIDELGINCSYCPVGNVVAGIHAGQQRRLGRAAAAGIALGADLQPLQPHELRARGLPAAFTCGYLERRGGVLDPGLYVRGLLTAAREEGAAVHERSPVLGVEPRPDGGMLLRTPRGELRADRVVIATNAYTRELRTPAGGPVAVRVTLLATEPLPSGIRERIGWGGEEGIYTAHEILESHRLTADGRIVSGSRYLRYGNGGLPLPDVDRKVFALTEAMLRRRFPEVVDLAIDRFWSGSIGFNLNFLPWVARSADRRVSWAVGFAGHGVALASLAGVWLSRLACDEDAGVPELTGARRLPMPPEPLRGMIAGGLLRGLELLDRRTDRLAG
jgi:glycine/D-amino acid oxidase-like deaminating enzyme